MADKMNHEEILDWMLCNTCPKAIRDNEDGTESLSFEFDLHCATLTIEAHVTSRNDNGMGAVAQFTITAARIE